MKLNYFGPIGFTGYGIVTTFFIPALKKAGIDVNVVPIYPDEIRVALPQIKQYINAIDTEQLNTDISLRLSIANPNDAMTFHGKKRIMWTMLEVDKIPPFWVKALNSVDEVWACSKWNKDVFKKSGVKTPIKVVPAGVDLGIFNPYREPLLEKNDNFKFLAVGKWEHRKGYDVLCQAFSEEFGADEKVELYINAAAITIFNPTLNIYREMLRFKLPEDRPEIFIIDKMIPDYRDMGRLYCSADCFVAPTRGEGWNLPLIEAMACGVPSIATNWSGQTEFINKKNCILLEEFELEPAKQKLAQVYIKYGKWANPSVKELRKKMRWVFENREKAKKIGEYAAKDMKNFSWDESAKKAKKHLEALIK